MKLYELSQNFKNIEALFENENIPKEDIEQALKELQGDINEKVDNIGKYIKNLENDALACDTEVKRLSASKKAAENKIIGLKTYLFEQLKSMNMNNVKTPLFNVRIQFSNPSVEVIDEKKIPKKYFIKQAATLDKREVLEDLKAGVKIKGCQIKQTEGLRIK